MKNFSVSLFIIFFACSSFIFASDIEKNDSIKTYNFNSIVVTGTRTKINQNNIPMAIHVIEKAEFEGYPCVNVPQILNYTIPSAFVTEKGLYTVGAFSVNL